ncbi:Nuclear speckle RNA-binding protein B [Zea mays]|uniref:Nuclear speckle RNA-binding protein B n=1 Tax=Zea mays TaxID=4577 RepID=A0A3L6D959_MAIZE|nr:Nuclear speckle RNA-binding protein B [Zea mays]
MVCRVLERRCVQAPVAGMVIDSRVVYPSYLAPEGSVASYYASRPVLPVGSDVLRNDVISQPRTHGYDGPARVTNPALAGLTGLPAGVTARGPSALEDPSLAGLSGLAPVRATGGATARGSGALEDPSLAGLSGLAPARALAPRALKEELDVVGRSSSVGRGASIPDVEHHSSIPNFDGPSENESNILFVDCLPTDCTRREVARILPAYYCPASYFFIFSGDKAYVLCFVEFENAKFARTPMQALQGYRFDDRKPDDRCLEIHFARFPFALPGAGAGAARDHRKR